MTTKETMMDDGWMVSDEAAKERWARDWVTFQHCSRHYTLSRTYMKPRFSCHGPMNRIQFHSRRSRLTIVRLKGESRVQLVPNEWVLISWVIHNWFVRKRGDRVCVCVLLVVGKNLLDGSFTHQKNDWSGWPVVVRLRAWWCFNYRTCRYFYIYGAEGSE